MVDGQCDPIAKWPLLRPCEVRYGKTATERILLYCTAIQTGLRHNELRHLTHANLFLDGDEPLITCKAG
jgi:hypothetical protein